ELRSRDDGVPAIIVARPFDGFQGTVVPLGRCRAARHLSAGGARRGPEMLLGTGQVARLVAGDELARLGERLGNADEFLGAALRGPNDNVFGQVLAHFVLLPLDPGGAGARLSSVGVL